MDNLASQQSVAAMLAVMPNLVLKKPKPSFQKIRNDFIRNSFRWNSGEHANGDGRTEKNNRLQAIWA